MRLLPVAILAVLLGACSSPAAPAPSTPDLPPPAEPAAAPPATTTPAGRTVPVGALPEGAVADAVTHLVAVGTRSPNELTIVNGRTGEVVHRVPVPGHLRHLQLAAPGGPVLVPDENSDELLTVRLLDGVVTSRVRTGTSPHDATAAPGGLFFAANEGGRSVAVVRGNQVVHTFTDVTQPAGLATIGTIVGLVDVRQNDLSLYDSVKLTRVGRVPAGAGPTHVVADKHRHFDVIDTRGNALLVYDGTRQVSKLDLPGTPYGVTYDSGRDRLWVTLTARNEVVGIDMSGAAPKVVQRLPTVRQPNTVAVDASLHRLYVTGTADGVLQLIDVRS